MQQLRLKKIPALLFAVSALVLLGAVTTLGLIKNSRGPGTTGLIPEVVCTADRPNYVTGEIVVRASNRLAGALVRLSGINQ